ncbi:MAG: MaoC/PaaZ C-terminal domain-containing protein [Anaerolineae bacterium]
MNTRGMYFEEFEVGMEMTSVGRTITETDVVNFAGLSGDYTQLHTDEEHAKSSLFGKRVAHGVLVLSIATGLAVRLGFIEGTALAFRELTWKFSQPVFFGDTIRVRARVKELKPMPRLGGGSVIFDVSVINQDGKTVQKGEWNMLVASQEGAG